jgi:hypothetical protein
MKATRERRAKKLIKTDWFTNKLWERFILYKKKGINNEEGD